MKILLVLNKILFRKIPGESKVIPRLDLGYWNVYLPLCQLGHEVYLYDTIAPHNKDFSQVVETFKPDLIWCCMTGNCDFFPYEPWEAVTKETESGRTKTFNWFCDDTWRFDNWSSGVCNNFTVCSTPEAKYIQKYKDIGYDNIILGAWHANLDLYPPQGTYQKTIDVSFCGAPNVQRQQMMFYLKEQGIDVTYFYGSTNEEILYVHAISKIGLNFSRNANDRGEVKTQMKSRMFEVPAAGTLLITEYTPGLEEYFKINEEIVCFGDNPMEMKEKIEFFLENPKYTMQVATAGYNRIVKEHQSHIRLSKVLEEIQKI